MRLRDGDVDPFALLADYGVPVVTSRTVAGRDAALAAADAAGYPVVLKTASPDVHHKLDVDGVRLHLTDHVAVAAAYDDLAGRLGPSVVVQAEVPGGVEVALGLWRDPLVGPLVLVAAGGSLVELLAERSVALPPVTAERAADLVARLRLSGLLAGHRGAPVAATEALVAAVVAFSQLAHELGDLLEAVDVNPIVVARTGSSPWTPSWSRPAPSAPSLHKGPARLMRGWTMRKLTYAMNATLDGYVAAQGDDISWGVPSPELHQWFNDRARELGVSLYGRRLWELMSGHWPTADQDPDATPVEVGSPALAGDPEGGLLLDARGGQRERAPGHRRRRGRDRPAEGRRRCPHGDRRRHSPAGAAMHAGLVDEYHVVTHPVLVGGGLPFFSALDNWVNLRLLETRTFPDGVTLSRYETRRYPGQTASRTKKRKHRNDLPCSRPGGAAPLGCPAPGTAR